MQSVRQSSGTDVLWEGKTSADEISHPDQQSFDSPLHVATTEAPAERADYERDVPLVRSQLPAHVIARAWKQGQTMSLEHAIPEALAVRMGGRVEPSEVDAELAR